METFPNTWETQRTCLHCVLWVISHQLSPKHRPHCVPKQRLEFGVGHLRAGRARPVYIGRQEREGEPLARLQLSMWVMRARPYLRRARLQMLRKPSESLSRFQHMKAAHKSGEVERHGRAPPRNAPHSLTADKQAKEKVLQAVCQRQNDINNRPTLLFLHS